MQRLRFFVNESFTQDLDDARNRGGLTSRGETFLNSFVLFHWALEQAEQGRKIVSIDPDGKEKVLVMPPLAYALVRNQINNNP